MEFPFKRLSLKPLQLPCPQKHLQEHFQNILSNAVAYTLPGHSIFVRIDGRKLIVENECEPISAEHLKHIFEPFYRPDYARNQNDGR